MMGEGVLWYSVGDQQSRNPLFDDELSCAASSLAEECAGMAKPQATYTVSVNNCANEGKGSRWVYCLSGEGSRFIGDVLYEAVGGIGPGSGWGGVYPPV